MTLTPVIAGLLFLWIIFILFWKVMAMFTKPPVERAPLAERMSYNIPLFIGFASLLVSLVPWTWPPLAEQIIPHTKYSFGLLVTAVGLGIAVWSRIALGANWSHTIVLLERHRLVTHGPYAYMRHPIYTGLLLMFLGTVVAIGTKGGIIGFVFLFISCWFKLHSEERLMIKRFPDAYQEYARRVKRLIPFFL